MAGDNPIFLPAPSFLYPKALFSKTLYLLQEPGDHLEIAPFWIVREANLHNGWELFYLNKRVANGQGVRVPELLPARRHPRRPRPVQGLRLVR